jgi:hypothetical protein
MRAARAARVALAVALAACAAPVSPEPLGDYTGWKRFDVTGPAPGHGDTYRVIYANAVAVDPAQSFLDGYADGAVIVKEIRTDAGGQPGELRYLAIMRRELSDPSLAGDGFWLFTQADSAEAAESAPSYCWRRCHQAAPYAGAWYDYRQ